MKKTLFTCLILVAVSLALFVSCNAETALPEDTDGLAYIRFGEDDARSFKATYDIADYDNLYWYYSAEKKDDYGKTGVTSSSPVTKSGTAPAKGLKGEIGPFSQGDWEFTLVAYAENDDKTGPDMTKKVYATKEGETIKVSLLGGETKSIPATVEAVGETGSIQFTDAFFKWNDTDKSNKSPLLTMTIVGKKGTTYTLTNDSTKLGKKNDNTKQIVLGDYDSGKGGYPIKFVIDSSASQDKDKYSQTVNDFDVDYYGVIVTAYLDGNESNPAAQDTTFAFRIYGGATTVISGDITENPKQKATFDVAKTEIVTQVAASSGATTVTAESTPATAEGTATSSVKTTIKLDKGILATPVEKQSDGSSTDVSVVVLVEASAAKKASESFSVSNTSGVVISSSIKIDATEIKSTTDSSGNTTTETKELKTFDGNKYATIKTEVDKNMTTEDYSRETYLKSLSANSSKTSGEALTDDYSFDENCPLVMYYNGEVDKTILIVSYDTSEGIIEFKTPHFSEFYLAYKDKGKFYNKSQNRYYTTLDAALKGASESKVDTIQLYDDAELSSAVAVSKAFTLDLNGKTLTVSGDAAFTVTSALTVRNGNIKTAENTSIKGSLFTVSGSGSLTLEGVTAEAALATAGTETALLTLTAGSASVKDSTLTLTNGVGISSKGTLTLDNSTVSGSDYGVVITAGNANITNSSKIKATSASATTSAALKVDGADTTTVTIGNGVTLTNENTGDASYQLYVKQESDDKPVRVEGTVDEKWKVNEDLNGAYYYPSVEAGIGNHYYAAFTEALTAATSASGTITLVKDVALTSDVSIGDILNKNNEATKVKAEIKDKGLTIDLNKKTLSLLNGNGILIRSSHNTTDAKDTDVVTIKNGNIVGTGGNTFIVHQGGNLALNGVKVTASVNGTKAIVFLYQGVNPGTLSVAESELNMTGAYGISTNALNGGDTKVYITIDHSTITTTSSDNDNTALLVNVPSDVTIKNNSTLSGERQGAVLRGGEYNISSSTFKSTGSKTKYHKHDSVAADDYENENWYVGNEVPLAALVIGNRGGSYAYATNVTLADVTLGVGESSVRKGLYIYQADKLSTEGDDVSRQVTVTGTLSSGSVATVNTSVNGALVSISQGNNYYVAGLDNLNTALNTADYVSLLDDIDVAMENTTTVTSPAVTVNKSLTLEGNGHKLESTTKMMVTKPLLRIGMDAKVSSEELYTVLIKNLDICNDNVTEQKTSSTWYAENARMVDIWDFVNGTITLENVNITSKGYGGSFRGISISDNKNTTINLNNVTVDIPSYYAINVSSESEIEVTLNINGSRIKGWAAINNFDKKLIVNAKNSTFESTTIWSGDGNDFSCIVVSNRDGFSSKRTNPTSSAEMEFEGCTFIANIGNDGETVRQDIFDIRNLEASTLTFIDCKFDPARDSDVIIYNNGEGNKENTISITENGKTIDVSGYIRPYTYSDNKKVFVKTNPET